MYRFRSSMGDFTIRQNKQRFELWFESVYLNSYSSAVAAADDVLFHKTGYQDWDRKESLIAPRNLSDWSIV